MNAWLQGAALWTWQNSLAAAALAAAVLVMRRVFRRQIAARWLCLAGWLVMLRLLLPAPLPHSWAWDRAWAGTAPHADSVKPTGRATDGVAIIDGAVPSLAQLQEEVAAARASLESLKASGLGPIHPEILSLSAELSTREQALTTLPVLGAEPGAGKINWMEIAAWIWIGGALGCALTILIRHIRFMRRLNRLARPVNLSWPGLADECASAVGLSRTPSLYVIPCGGSPFLCGLFRSRIVLPAEVLAALTLSETRHVLLHEMLHIARRDLFTNWLLAAMRIWHWFNPLVHAVSRRLLADREVLRDGQAIALLRDPGQRSAYGHTLLKLALPLAAPVLSPGLAPLFHSQKELQRRITMIQSPVPRRRLAACATAGALALISAPLFTTARGQAKAEVEKSAPPPAVEKKDFEVIQPPLPKADRADPILPPAASGSPAMEMDQLTGQLSVLKELKGDQWLAGALALGGEKNSTLLAKVYPEYQAEVATLGSLIKSGFGPKHPKTLGLKESIRLKHQQMEAAAETYRQSLLFRLAAAKAGIAADLEVPTAKSASAAPEVASPPGDEAQKPLPPPFQNLSDTAAALRKKGQNDEAATIENALKELAAEKSVKEQDRDPKADPKSDYYRKLKQATGEYVELEQMRAEMAAIKAALKELQARSQNESPDELLKLKQTKSFGKRNPSPHKSPDELLKEAMKRDKITSPGELLKEAMKRDNEKLFRKKDPGATDAEGAGDAVEKPARKSSDEKQADPNGADVNKLEKLLKDSADQMKSEIARFHAEPAQKTDQNGENLPWAVAVPGKIGLVYSPYSPKQAIVDVSGFKTGDTVKCPYTSHLFHVPDHAGGASHADGMLRKP